jgi:1-acyl-sn-glycerol-3-phosphate acyltransferase
MRLLLKPLQWVYSLYAMILFVGIMLLLFPFVIIASFFGRIAGGNMIFQICMLWADIWFPLIFVFHRKIYDKPHDRSKQYIFLSNHISYLDAAILPKAFRQPVRALAKIELAKVPIFGFIYRKAVVTVDRSSPENRALSILLLRSIIAKGISVIVFPEGTFNITHRPLKDFYDGAFRLAIETQTPIKPVLFLDAYSRMNYQSIFSMTPGRCRLVYMQEFPVAGLTLADTELLKQKVFKAMEQKLIEFKVAWIKAQ